MSHQYKTLVGAEIYRDGGSLEASFVLHDGGFEILFLEVYRERGSFEISGYGRLLVYSDLDRESDPVVVEKTSTLEVEILSSLHSFMTTPIVDVPFAHKTPKSVFLEKVSWLIEGISERIQGFEQDVTANR